MQVKRVPINSIKADGRVREDYGDIESLAASLKQNGLLQPIVIDEKNCLVAGGRRLRAATILGWSEIDAHVLSGLNPLQKLDIEVKENLVRKDLTDAEIAKSIEMKKRLMRPPWYTQVLNFFKKILRWFVSLFKRS